MVRSVLADESLLPYFTNLAKQNTCTIGLILGQSNADKDYVIHFAKTPALKTEGEDENEVIKSIGDLNEGWIADHARQAIKMLPGGIYILGIFVVAPDDLLTPFPPKLKSILSQIHKTLETTRYAFGDGENSDKLVLCYCSKAQEFSSKSYDVATASVKTVDFKFVPKATNWVQLECNLDLEEIYYIAENEKDWPLKTHMGIILDKFNENLNSSIFLYNSELKADDDLIESVGKKAKNPKSKFQTTTNDKPLKVSIFQLCSNKDPSKNFTIHDSNSQIKIVGQVVTKTWLNPKATIQSATAAVIQDIMRSLSIRLEMHWDSLTEEEHAEDINSIHEPPRRVLVTLPHSPVAISDYLFPGEGPQDAQISLEEMLDIKIHEKSDIQDVEGQADLTDYYTENLESEPEEDVEKSSETKQSNRMLIGILLAFLVLILALVIHFIQQHS